jgi:hypothetical protein
LRQLLQEFTAGDPMREGVLWTNLSLRELSRRLIGMGTPASRRTIRRLLRKLKIGRRTARKKKTMGHHPDRNAQFENIARLREATSTVPARLTPSRPWRPSTTTSPARGRAS